MKLRVNLYTQALQPVKEKISLNLIAYSLAGALIFLTLMSIALTFLADSKKSELKQIQNQVKLQEKQIAQLQTELGSRAPSAILVKQQSELKQAIVQKQKLLQFVQGEQKKTSVKYSPIFDYLATIDPQGLWLESFSLSATSSQFSGYVIEPELLPEWLTKLSSTAFFKGHTFAQFEIRQQENMEALSFKVVSSAATIRSKTSEVAPVAQAAEVQQ
ncbi:MAG: PilN domain-containing protein [Pararheinheimera sp.]|nr:PilN domain-containing protein [Rheinheimera sp.]